jgi:vancomycin resistance protein VanW
MLKPLSKPQLRPPLRMALGKAWFVARRRLSWYLSSVTYATTRSSDDLGFSHASHRTPVLRQLKGVDMWLLHNKPASLKVAASCLDGLVLKSGETFSFWRLVGKPSARRGLKAGMVLRNGTTAKGMGDRLCEMTNMIYWMALHSEPSVTERWRHGFDVIPDGSRTQPFASKATCSHNYIDLQISNTTENTDQLRLRGRWRLSCRRMAGRRAAKVQLRNCRARSFHQDRVVGRIEPAQYALPLPTR